MQLIAQGEIMTTYHHHPASFVIDAAGVIRSWSVECQWLLGATADEAVGRPFQDYLPASQKHGFTSHIELARSKAVQRQAEMIALDRTSLSVQMTIAPQYRRNGDDPEYYVVIVELASVPQQDPKPLSDIVLFKRFSESLPGPFYVLDQIGHLVLWNSQLEYATQMNASELQTAHALDFFDDKEKATIKQKMRNAFELGKSSVEATVIAKDGSRTPYLFNCARTALDEQICICGMGIDITERKRMEDMLRLHQRAIQASVNGVAIARRHGGRTQIDYANPAFEDITGYSLQEAAGRDLLFLCEPELDRAEQDKLRHAITHAVSIHVIIRNRHKSGELFWNDLRIAPVADAEGAVTHIVAVMSDATESKYYEAQLEHLANHDPLTGLANRNLLHEHLDLAIQHARRRNVLIALAFIDLDNFKFINDNLGHAAGDQVLRIVAHRLRDCMRELDTVARVGGDEFVIIFASQPSLAHILELLERVRHSLGEPLPTDGQDIFVNASIGVSVFPRDGLDAETLLRGADAAMYHAKFIGRNNFQFYSTELNTAVRQRLRLEASLRDAIDRHEMFLVFQPKVDLKTGCIVGAEALVRWQHPVRGVLSPAEFIPVAEETGLIVPLGDWALTCACSVLKKLHAHGFPDFSIAINLSGRQFKQRNFVDHLTEQIRSTGLEPQALELELTESQLMDNPIHAAQILSQLKNLGVRISIDDFGTGYSSLSYLQKFPVDSIKIDRSFVHDVGETSQDGIITKAVISLGHNLNVQVIAEGVETEGQLAFLRRYHCDQVQGYYFSKPVSSQRLHTLLKMKKTLQRSRWM